MSDGLLFVDVFDRMHVIDIALRADLDTITFIAHADRQWDKTTLDKPI